MTKVKLLEIIKHVDELLSVDQFKDYCPNGLQVSGASDISKIVTGVSANDDLITKANDWGADLILVHHGLFWHKQSPCITGVMQQRVKGLLSNNTNLAAYHLPLDGHKSLGNNVLLAKKLGAKVIGDLDSSKPSIGLVAALPFALSAQNFASKIHNSLGQKPMVFGDNQIKNFGICSGAAQHDFLKAIDLGLDAYITGEVAEFVPNMAKESGVSYFAAGHHATEVLGIQALGEYLANKFTLEHKFINIDNIV